MEHDQSRRSRRAGTGPSGAAPARAWPIGSLLLALLLGYVAAQVNSLGVDTTPSAWCDEVFPAPLIQEVAFDWTDPIERRTSGWVAEEEGTCNRLYTAVGARFSDELVFLLTSGYSPEGGVRNVEFIGNDAEGESWDVTWIDDLGHRGVRFFRLDPLRSSVGELNVSFAVGEWLVELKYMNWDDGLPTKFLQSLDEVEALARLVADRLTGDRP